MNEDEVATLWDENAPAWVLLARGGYDIHRDEVNTPAFLAMLPDVAGLDGLDIGCGEGHNTRLVAGRGARMCGVDISKEMIRAAHVHGATSRQDVRLARASASALPFGDESFDFVVSTMAFMDMPQIDEAIREAHRVLRPGGFLQFSIGHPCFQTRLWQWIHDESGKRVAVVCGDYFAGSHGEIDEFCFSSPPKELRDALRPFRIPRFLRPLSTWMNLAIDTGFVVERLAEPTATDDAIARLPQLADTRAIAYFLIVRCRRPLG